MALAQVAFSGSGIVVLYGEASQKEASEKRFAKSLANHAVRWLKDCGISASIASDSEADTALADGKVAILVHCAEPTAKQLSAYKRFKSRGGRLIVTYSSSASLADIVGVALGKYKRDASRASMVFSKDSPKGVPAEPVAQSSPNIVEAFPVAGRSRVIARWADSKGVIGGDAAWLAGDGGYWMTHVLLADGDAKEKGELLMALAASVDPALWGIAASERLSKLGAVGSWKDIHDGRAAAASVTNPRRRKLATGEIQAAETAKAAAEKMLRMKREHEAWVFAKEAAMHLERAYGLAQTPTQGEIKAVWDHNGCGLYPGDWKRTCRELKDAGITDIFLNCASPVSASCNLVSVPRSHLFERFGDQLAACIAAAHPCGIRVHAWLMCFGTSGATKEQREEFRKKGWLVDATAGGQQDWLDPSSAAVRSKVTAIATEIMEKYRIDGLHLDFIRYQDYYGSLGYGTRIRYQRDAGVTEIKDWPNAAKSGALFRKIADWRCRQVTSLVATIRASQRKNAPRILVSAAVLGKYPACIDSVGQDWMSWLECGYIDYAMPMNYTESLEKYRELLAVQTKRSDIAGKIVGGIGVTAAESRLDPAKAIDQINELRKRGAAGFILFDLDKTLSSETLPTLSLGIASKMP